MRDFFTMKNKHTDKSLSKDEFNQAVKLLNLNRRGQEAAYRVMVDGLSRRAAGAEYGYSTGQAVQNVVDKIWQQHLELSGGFPGWSSIRVYLPDEQAEEVQALADRLRAEYIQTLGTTNSK